MPKATLLRVHQQNRNHPKKISSTIIPLFVLVLLAFYFQFAGIQLSHQNNSIVSNQNNHWKISTIIPSCNRLHSLEDAIHSVLQQTYPIYEIIVACDSGPHCIPATNIQNVWKDPRIRFLQVPPNYPGVPGPGRARKFALEHTHPQSTHYALLDDDDEWFPEKTQVQVERMQAQNYAFSSSDAAYPVEGVRRCVKSSTTTSTSNTWKSHDLSITNRANYEPWNGHKWFSVLKTKFQLQNEDKLPSHITHELLKIHNIFVTSSVLMAKEVYVGFQEQDEIGHEDYKLWLRILEKTNGLFITDPLVVYDNRRNDCDVASTSRLLLNATYKGRRVGSLSNERETGVYFML